MNVTIKTIHTVLFQVRVFPLTALYRDEGRVSLKQVITRSVLEFLLQFP